MSVILGGILIYLSLYFLFIWFFLQSRSVVSILGGPVNIFAIIIDFISFLRCVWVYVCFFNCYYFFASVTWAVTWWWVCCRSLYTRALRVYARLSRTRRTFPLHWRVTGTGAVLAGIAVTGTCATKSIIKRQRLHWKYHDQLLYHTKKYLISKTFLWKWSMMSYNDRSTIPWSLHSIGIL